MTTPELSRAVRALAEVRASLSGPAPYSGGGCGVWKTDELGQTGIVFNGSQTGCYTFIDEQMASAVIESLMPVSDGMEEAARVAMREANLRLGLEPNLGHPPRYSLTAALNYVLGKDKG